VTDGVTDGVDGADARSTTAQAWLDAAPIDEARAALTRCCGAHRWVEGMLARRPFGAPAAMREAAEATWTALGAADYLEAFSHHPEIGADPASLRARFPSTRDLSAREQAGVERADETTLRDLAEANQAYRARFGHIFIVCATGKSAAEMLALLRDRIDNEPPTELAIAAREQAKITALRLENLGR
jgi:2-oxo-4-hydroxy-4-carboxy-5-ureidoimidazoline decarboxylase